MWAFTFTTFLSAFLLFPVVPLRIVELGGTKVEAGWFLAIYTFACAMSAPLSGAIADTMGRRRVLVTGAIAFLIASAAYGVISLLPLLLAFACLHGVFWSGLLSSSSAIISEIIPVSRRAEGLAWWGMASSAAMAIAPAAGLVVYRMSGWRAVALLMVLLSCGMLALATRVRGGAPVAGARFPHVKKLIEWRVIVVAMTLTCIAFGYGGVTSYVAMLSLERQIEPASLFFTVFAGTIVVSRVFLAPVADRRGPMWLLLPSLIAIPIALGLIAVSHGRISLAIAGVLYGLGFGCAYPAFVTWLLPRTEESRRGATFGSMLWAFDTGIGAGSLTLGFLAEHYGFTNAFLAAAVLAIAALPVFFLTSRLLPGPGAVPSAPRAAPGW